LIKANFNTKTHAFGWIGSLEEIKQLAQAGVTTIDSSGPVWRGLNGYYNNQPHWPDFKFDPGVNIANLATTPRELVVRNNIAKKNLTEVLRACASL
jgi:hypothetical protein